MPNYITQVNKGTDEYLIRDTEANDAIDLLADIATNDHTKMVKFYNTESDKPTVLDVANGITVGVGEIAYVLETREWYIVSSIDSSTLSITWSSYDPGLGGVAVVTTMPTSPKEGDVVVYAGDTTDDFENNTIYRYDGTEWLQVTKKNVAGNGISIDDDTGAISATTVTYRGTKEAWDNLTTAEKIKYTDFDFTDYDADTDTEERLKELESTLAIKDISSSLVAGSNITLTQVNAKRQGNVVMISFVASPSTNLISGDVILTGCPKVSVMIQCCCNEDVWANMDVQGRILADHDWSASAGGQRVTVTYITTDD